MGFGRHISETISHTTPTMFSNTTWGGGGGGSDWSSSRASGTNRRVKPFSKLQQHGLVYPPNPHLNWPSQPWPETLGMPPTQHQYRLAPVTELPVCFCFIIKIVHYNTGSRMGNFITEPGRLLSDCSGWLCSEFSPEKMIKFLFASCVIYYFFLMFYKVFFSWISTK